MRANRIIRENRLYLNEEVIVLQETPVRRKIAVLQQAAFVVLTMAFVAFSLFVAGKKKITQIGCEVTGAILYSN